MENELSRVVDALPGLVWTAFPDGEIDFLNHRWCEYTGLSVDEGSGQGWLTAVHPDDLPGLVERWRSVLASGEPREMEARLRRFDGEYRWFLFRTYPLRDASGQVVKWCGMNSEINDRSGFEGIGHTRWRLSSAAREDFRSIVDDLPTFVTLMTPDGELELANRQVLEYFGATLEELRARPSASTVHPDDRPDVLAAWRESLENGQPYEVVGRQRRADGVYRWFHMRAFPLRDTDGRILLWYLSQTDVDDRKRADALLASENRLLEMIATGASLSATLTELCMSVESLCADCTCCSILLLNPDTKRLWHAASPNVPKAFTESIDGFAIGPDVSSCGTAAYVVKQVIASDIASDPRWAEFRAVALANGLRACWSTPILSQQNVVLGTFAMFSNKPSSPTREDQEVIAQITHLASIAIERAQNDAALKQSEARKAAILDSALDCVVTIDHEGCITEFNPAAERSFGYRREEVVGQQLADVIIPPAFRQEHRRGFARYLATGEERVLGRRIEMTGVRADGSEFPVELAITRIPLDGPPSFTGYLRDITERKHSEAELRRSEALLAGAQRISSTGSFSWRVATDEIRWSEEAYRIYGIGPGVPVTFDLIRSRVHPENLPMLEEVIDRARREGGDFDYESRLVMPDGSVKYIHVVAHGGRNPDGELELIGAVQDVTERRRSEDALSKARSELTHVARVTSLGAVTAPIANEVNQPLSGIVTNASTCLRMLAADPPNIDGARETARRTIRDGNRLSDVITRLRALFSKKETTFESLDLNEAIREVIALSLSELHRGRVILRTELADNLPLVTGDRVQLQQVVLNLLRNASDAMSSVNDRPRHIVITTEREEGDRVRLTVQDEGVGLDPQAMDRLFEAFYTTKNEGMGMGLSISRSIIERHRGRLWAAPNDGPGATFSFSIPCGLASATGARSLGVIATPAAKDAKSAQGNP